VVEVAISVLCVRHVVIKIIMILSTPKPYVLRINKRAANCRVDLYEKPILLSATQATFTGPVSLLTGE
jgi:hypothetical protein